MEFASKSSTESPRKRTAGIQAFVTQGLDPSPWLLRAGLGLTYQANDRTEVTARFDAEFRQDFLSQSASVKMKWTF